MLLFCIFISFIRKLTETTNYLIDTLAEFPDIYRVEFLDTYLERAKDAG